MRQIIIKIERSKDGTFCAYGENVIGVYGMGNTVKEVMESAINGLHLFIKYNALKNLPAILKGKFKINFQFNAKKDGQVIRK